MVDECSICLQGLESNIGTYVPCGHCIHIICFQEYLVTSKYKLNAQDEINVPSSSIMIESDPIPKCPVCRSRYIYFQPLHLTFNRDESAIRPVPMDVTSNEKETPGSNIPSRTGRSTSNHTCDDDDEPPYRNQTNIGVANTSTKHPSNNNIGSDHHHETNTTCSSGSIDSSNIYSNAAAQHHQFHPYHYGITESVNSRNVASINEHIRNVSMLQHNTSLIQRQINQIQYQSLADIIDLRRRNESHDENHDGSL